MITDLTKIGQLQERRIGINNEFGIRYVCFEFLWKLSGTVNKECSLEIRGWLKKWLGKTSAGVPQTLALEN